MLNSVTSGAHGSAGPLRKRERKLLESFNAKEGKVIKKGRKAQRPQPPNRINVIQYHSYQTIKNILEELNYYFSP